jgi:hypothetical protein
VVAIDVETGQLAGYWVAMTVVHLEPVYILPEFRGETVWRALADRIQEPFRENPGSGFYVFIPKGRDDLKHMAASEGMRILDWEIAEKRF